MKKRKHLVRPTDAPIKLVESTITDVETKIEDVDTITLQFTFQNGSRILKRFYKYDYNYRTIWKNKKSGDSVVLKVKAGNIIDIC